MSDADLTDPLWGTGYGSKRHLVDMATVRDNATGRRDAYSCCGDGLRQFADSDRKPWGGRKAEAELVASRPPCVRCLKIAAKEAQL